MSWVIDYNLKGNITSCTFGSVPTCTFVVVVNCTFVSVLNCTFQSVTGCTFEAVTRCTFEACCSVMQFFGSDYKSNNAFYQVLMPLPILFFFREKILRFIFLVIAIYICVVSLKRSALIGVLIIAAVYLYSEVLVNNKSRLYTVLILMITLFVLSQYVDLSIVFQYYDATMERMNKISEDGGSGRLDMIVKFLETDLYDIYFIFGKGFMGYHDKYPQVLASHNDLIEIYYSYGLLGLSMFLIFFRRLLKNTFGEIKGNHANILSYLSALMLFILCTFTGGCFTFVNLSLSFFSFIALSQAQLLIKNEN